MLEFVSEITHADMEENPSSRKRKSPEDNNVVVTSYTQANRGPYPQDIAKKNSTRFTPDQGKYFILIHPIFFSILIVISVSALVAASTSGVTIVSGPTGSGKTKTASQIISNLYHSQERVFVVSPDSQMLSRLFAHILDLDVDLSDVVWLGNEAETEKSPVNCSVTGRVNDFLQQRLFLLGKVETLARSLEQPPGHGYTCETAGYFFKSIIQPKWENFLRLAKSEDTVKSNFPFSGFFSDAPNPVFSDKMSFEAALEAATGCYQHIQKLFGKLEKMRAFEILKSDMDRGNYILKKVSKIIAITISSLCTMYEDLLSLGLNFESAVVMDAQHLRDVQSLTPLCLQTLSSNSGSSVLKRAILFGDRNQLQGTSGGLNCLQNAALNQSLFERLIKTGVSSNDLFCQFTARPSLVKLYESWYGGNLKTVADQFQEANPGFCFDYQFVDVPDYGGQGELEPRSGFLQNLGEAEYSVALYQYMRLIGYPSDKITILTPFNGQRELILDVLQRRCSWHPFFGSPKGVFNIDEYHCDQNDIVILSLVRTKAYDGILRDRRTWISALSKARRGVYVVGRHSLFKQAWSVQSIVDQMETRPVSGLWLQTGESYEQCARASGDSGIKLNSKTQKWDKAKDSAVQEIKSLAELGALVQTLTQNKVALMKAQKQRQA